MNSIYDHKQIRQVYFLYLGIFLGAVAVSLALFYRPFIYKNGIYDFHFADTLGSLFCVPTSVFLFYGTSKKYKFGTMVFLSTVAFLIYEIPSSITDGIDIFDYLAILLGALITCLIFLALKKIFHLKELNKTNQ